MTEDNIKAIQQRMKAVRRELGNDLAESPGRHREIVSARVAARDLLDGRAGVMSLRRLYDRRRRLVRPGRPGIGIDRVSGPERESQTESLPQSRGAA